MKRRDFLKLTAAASFTAATAACNAASAASSGPASSAPSGAGLSLTTNEGDAISFASLEH